MNPHHEAERRGRHHVGDTTLATPRWRHHVTVFLGTILLVWSSTHFLEAQPVKDYWISPVKQGAGTGDDEGNAAAYDQTQLGNRLLDPVTYPNLKVRFLGESEGGVPGNYGVTTYLVIVGDPDSHSYDARKRRVTFVGETRNGRRARLFLDQNGIGSVWANTAGAVPLHRLIVSGSVAGKRYYLRGCLKTRWLYAYESQCRKC